jgi:hypothetical protein
VKHNGIEIWLNDHMVLFIAFSDLLHFLSPFMSAVITCSAIYEIFID